MSIILYAIPGFFLLIGIELLLEHRKKSGYYRINDAINSLTAGVLSRMTGIVRQLLPFTLYAMVFDTLAVSPLPDTALTWIAAFVLYDFFYYWNHRLGHEISILWAAHVVHHSSEEYNLTTALRQTSGSLLSWVFYLPMAVMGFDPMMVLTVGALNLVYQFWVHTRHIGKLGWYEWFFVTPSNHRVHHAINQCYIDRNYGGVFIIWDRLFGTYQAELQDESPVYGVRKALHSWNPVWANCQVYSQLIKDSWRTKKWSDKLRVWFGRTGWRPADISARDPRSPFEMRRFRKFDIPLSPVTKSYALLQHLITIVIALTLMLNVERLPVWQQLSVVIFVVASTVSQGWLMERRYKALWIEAGKNLMLVVLLPLLSLPVTLNSALLALCLLSLGLLWWVRKDVGAVVAQKQRSNLSQKYYPTEPQP